MNILAIDPGTHCGYAYNCAASRSSGVWNLKVQRYEGDGMRYVRLRQYLQQLYDSTRFELIVFEEVRRHAGVLASHIYGGIVSHIMEYAEQHKINYVSCPVGTLKKFATGKGNANKDQMVQACQKRLSPNTTDDNEADALWLHEWAKVNYGNREDTTHRDH